MVIQYTIYITLFILAVLIIVIQDDDDDDHGGGILQPVYNNVN